MPIRVGTRFAAYEVTSSLGSGGMGEVYRGFDTKPMVGIHRERGSKLRHKALIWGMYVTPTSRRHGVASKLLKSVLDPFGRAFLMVDDDPQDLMHMVRLVAKA